MPPSQDPARASSPAGWEFQDLGDGKRVWGAADDIKEMVNSLPDVVFKEGHAINHHIRGLTGSYREPRS